MLSTGNIDTPSSHHPLMRTVSVAPSPLLQGVNVNSNNSNNNNNNMPLQLQVVSMADLSSSTHKSKVHPFARPLQHCTSLPIINVPSVIEEDTPSHTGSLSQSNKSGLLKQLSPYSSCSSLDIHSATREGVRSLSLDRVSSKNLKPMKSHSPLLSSISMPCLMEALANNDCTSNSTSTQPISSTRKDLDNKVEKKKDVPNSKPAITSPPPPPLPPPRRMDTLGPTTYSSSTLPVKKKKAIQKSPTYLDLFPSNGQQPEATFGVLPKYNSPPKSIKRRRSISVSDFRSSLEKTSLKITSLCSPDSLKKAAIMKLATSKSPKKNSQPNLVREPSDYNVSVKEMMAIRAAMTTSSQPSIEPNVVVVKPSPPRVPQRSSSLVSSDTSDEDIILQYKRMSSDSLFSFKDIEAALDANSHHTAKPNSAPIYDVAVSNDDTLYAVADHKVEQEAGHLPPVSSVHVYNVAYPKPNHQHQDRFTYDHLDFSKPPVTSSGEHSNTTATFNNSQVPQEYEESYVVEQLTTPVTSHPTSGTETLANNYYYNVATQDVMSESNSLWQCGKKPSHSGKQESQIKGFSQAARTGRRNYSSPHIYEDVDSDYDEIDESDEEDYVVMESKPPGAPAPPPPPPFAGMSITANNQMQTTSTSGHTAKSFSPVAPVPPPPPLPASFTEKAANKTGAHSLVGQNVGMSSSSVSLKKSSVTQSGKEINCKKIEGIDFQEELKNKLQAMKATGQTSMSNSHTLQTNQQCAQDTTTVKGSAAPHPVKAMDPKLSELEKKFQVLKSSHGTRAEMIEKTESKLVTTTSTTKRIKLHGYTNVSKKFMVIKEEKDTEI